MQVCVTILSGALAGQQRECKPPFSIGRDLGNALALTSDLDVSRKHAEIFAEGGRLCIRDLNSRHGTLVNGKLLKGAAVLHWTDRIQLGPQGPELKIGPVEQRTAAAAPIGQAMGVLAKTAAPPVKTRPFKALDEAEVVVELAGAPEPAPCPPVKPSDRPPQKRRGLFWGLVFLGFILLLLAGAGLAFYLYLNSIFAEDNINAILRQQFGAGAAASSANLKFPDALEISRVFIPQADNSRKAAVEIGNITVNWEPWEMWRHKRLKSIIFGRVQTSLCCDKSGKWNVNLAKQSGEPPVRLDQCHIRVLEGDLNLDLAGVALSARQFALNLTLPDADEASVLRVNNIRALLEAPQLRFKGRLSGTNWNLGLDPNSAEHTFEGRIVLDDCTWDSGRGWASQLNGQNLFVKGSVKSGENEPLQLSLERLEMDDVGSLRELTAKWDTTTGEAVLTGGQLRLDLAGLRKILPGLQGLSWVEGQPALELEHLRFAEVDHKPRLEFMVRRAKNANSIGVSITPPLVQAANGPKLLEIEDFDARVEVNPETVKVADVRLRVNCGPTYPGTAAFSTWADLTDEYLPLWLQMVINLKDFKLAIPLGPLQRSEYVRSLLNPKGAAQPHVDGLLLTDALTVAAQSNNNPKTICLNLKGLQLRDLQVTEVPENWPLGKLDEKFAAQLEAEILLRRSAAPAAQMEIQNVIVKSRLNSVEADVSQHIQIEGEAHLDSQLKPESVEKIGLTLPLGRLPELFPLLKAFKLDGEGSLTLADGLLNWNGAELERGTGTVKFQNAAITFSLGEKSPVKGGVVGFQNIFGEAKVELARTQKDCLRAELKGRWSSGDLQKPLQFFAYNFKMEPESLETVDLNVAADWALESTGKREVKLDLKWSKAGKPGHFTLNANVYEAKNSELQALLGKAAPQDQVWEIETEIDTSLLGGIKGGGKTYYDVKSGRMIPVKLELKQVNVPALLQDLAVLLGKDTVPQDLQSLRIPDMKLELMPDAGPQSNALGPAAPAKWELKAELDELAGGGMRVVDAEKNPVKLSLAAVALIAPDWKRVQLGNVQVRFQGPAQFEVGGWRFFFGRRRQYSIECQGWLGLAAASRFPEFNGEWSLQWPPCELFAPTAKLPIQLPAGTLQLSGGEDLSGVKTASEVDAPRMDLAKTVLELPGLASLRLSGLQVKLPPAAAPPPGRASSGPAVSAAIESLDIPDLARIQNLLQQLGLVSEMDYALAGTLRFTAAKDTEGKLSPACWQPNQLRLQGDYETSSITLTHGSPAETILAMDRMRGQCDLQLERAPDRVAYTAQGGLRISLPEGFRIKPASEVIAFSPGDVGCAFKGTFSRTMKDEREVLCFNVPKMEARHYLPGEDKPYPLLDFACDEIRVVRHTGRKAGELAGIFIKQAAFCLHDLSWFQEQLARPLLKSALPQAAELQFSGGLGGNADIAIWNGNNWAVRGAVKPVFMGIVQPERLAVKELDGTIPVALSSNIWPPDWSAEAIAGNAGWNSIRYKLKTGEKTAVDVCLAPGQLPCAAKPNEFSLGQPLIVELPGSQLRFENVRIKEPLNQLHQLAFDLSVESDLAALAQPLDLNLKSYGLIPEAAPILEGRLPVCRFVGNNKGPLSWGFSMGGAEPDQLAWLQVRPKESKDAPLRLDGIQLRNFHAPGLPNDSPEWAVERLELREIHLGNLGALFAMLGRVDVELRAILENFSSAGTTGEELLEKMRSWHLQLYTSKVRPRESPYYIELTRAIKDKLCEALDLGGLERWFINKKERYDFRAIGMEIFLKDGLLFGLPQAQTEKGEKKQSIIGTGTFDPGVAANIQSFWKDLQNALLTFDVDPNDFKSHFTYKYETLIEQARRDGAIGEGVDGYLHIMASASGQKQLEDIVRENNAHRKTSYETALEKFYHLQDISPDRKQQLLTRIAEKAGRLMRIKFMENSVEAQAFVQHPLTGEWMRASSLKSWLDRKLEEAEKAQPSQPAAKKSE